MMEEGVVSSEVKSAVPEPFYDLFAHVIPSILTAAIIAALFMRDEKLTHLFESAGLYIWMWLVVFLLVADVYGQLASTLANTVIKRWVVAVLANVVGWISSGLAALSRAMLESAERQRKEAEALTQLGGMPSMPVPFNWLTVVLRNERDEAQRMLIASEKWQSTPYAGKLRRYLLQEKARVTRALRRHAAAGMAYGRQSALVSLRSHAWAVSGVGAFFGNWAKLLKRYVLYYFLCFRLLPQSVQQELAAAFHEEQAALEGRETRGLAQVARFSEWKLGLRHHEILLGYFRCHAQHVTRHLLKKYAGVKVERALAFNLLVLSFVYWWFLVNHPDVVESAILGSMIDPPVVLWSCFGLTLLICYAFFRRQSWYGEVVTLAAHRISRRLAK